MNLRKHFNAISLLAIGGVTLLSCTPAAVYRLHPVAGETRWLFGQEFVSSADSSVEVSVAFDRTWENLLVFEVEIVNISGQMVTVSPEQFYYLPLVSLEQLLEDKRYFAVDPEEELLEIDKRISRQNANHRTYAALDATATVVDVAEDIVTIGQPKTEQEVESDIQDNLERDAARRDEEITHENRIINLNELRDTWAFTTLRKTTLANEETVSGKVYFPCHPRAPYLQVHVPIGASLNNFIFQQQKHLP